MIALRQSNLYTLPDGIYPDGNNLYFRVRNQGRTREFLYRCTIKGKATFKSLGSIKKLTTLKEARQRAKEYIPEDSCPKILFKDAYLKALPHVSNFKHWKHEEYATKRFEETIRIYWLPYLGNYYVSQLTVEDVVKACKINWETKPASCERALGNLRSLFKVFITLVYCKTNLAIWVNNLENFLPPISKIYTREHRKFITPSETQTVIKDLLGPYYRRNDRVGIRIYLVIFVALSALRVSEALSIKWSYLKESDALGKYIEIPAIYRKGFRTDNHLVPLTEEMEYIFSKIPKKSEYIFYSVKDPSSPIKRTSATRIFQDRNINCTFHGFRSTFRVWAAENSLDHDASEFILSHEIGTRVTRSYYRTDLYQERKKILTQWNKYLFSNITLQYIDILYGFGFGPNANSHYTDLSRVVKLSDNPLTYIKSW